MSEGWAAAYAGQSAFETSECVRCAYGSWDAATMLSVPKPHLPHESVKRHCRVGAGSEAEVERHGDHVTKGKIGDEGVSKVGWYGALTPSTNGAIRLMSSAERKAVPELSST